MNRTLLVVLVCAVVKLGCDGTTDVGDHLVLHPVPPITVAGLVGPLDGGLLTLACGVDAGTRDCPAEGWRFNGGPLNTCVNEKMSAVLDFPLNGETGENYDISVHFYGILEPHLYGGSTLQRDALAGPSNREGGLPLPWASVDPREAYRGPVSIFNTYELHVYDAQGVLQTVYLLNSDSDTGPYSLLINYAKTFTVFGGGRVQLVIEDSNCRILKNCGGDKSLPCAPKVDSIDVSAAEPQPAAGSLLQPGLGNEPENAGQWLLLDVTSVEQH